MQPVVDALQMPSTPTGMSQKPEQHSWSVPSRVLQGCRLGRQAGGGVLSTTGLGLGGGGDGRGGGEGGKGGLGGLGGGGGFGGGRAHESNRLVHELEVVLQQPLQQGLPATQTRPAAMHGGGGGGGGDGLGGGGEGFGGGKGVSAG